MTSKTTSSRAKSPPKKAAAAKKPVTATVDVPVSFEIPRGGGIKLGPINSAPPQGTPQEAPPLRPKTTNAEPLDKIEAYARYVKKSGSTASYGFIAPDRTESSKSTVFTRGCFGGLGTTFAGYSDKDKGYWFVSKSYDGPHDRYWVELLIDEKRSPWKALRPWLVSTDPEWIMKFGYVFRDLDTVPCALLYSFLMATRVPWEHKTVLDIQQKLLDLGVPELKAYWAGHLSYPYSRSSGREPPVGKRYYARYSAHTFLNAVDAYLGTYRFLSQQPNWEVTRTQWVPNDRPLWYVNMLGNPNERDVYERKPDGDFVFDGNSYPYSPKIRYYSMMDMLADIDRWYETQEKAAK